MNKRIIISASAALLILLPALTANAGHTGCPTNIPPACTDDSCVCSSDSPIPVGRADPIDMRYGNTLFRRTDVTLNGPVKPFKFSRFFTNSSSAWTPSGTIPET